MTNRPCQRLLKLLKEFRNISYDDSIQIGHQLFKDPNLQKTNILEFLKSKQNLFDFIYKKQQIVDNSQIITTDLLDKYILQLKKQLVQAYMKLKNQDQIYQRSNQLCEQIIFESGKIISQKLIQMDLLTNQYNQIKFQLEEQKQQKHNHNKDYLIQIQQLKHKIIQYHKTINLKQQQIDQLYTQLAQYELQIDQLKSIQYQKMMIQIKQEQKGQQYLIQTKEMQKIINKLQFQLKQSQIVKNQFFRQIKYLNQQVLNYRSIYQKLLQSNSQNILKHKTKTSNNKRQVFQTNKSQDKSSYKKVSQIFINQLQLKHQNSNQSYYTKQNLQAYQNQFSFKDSLQNSLQRNQKSMNYIENIQQYQQSKQLSKYKSKENSKQKQNKNLDSNQIKTVLYNSQQNQQRNIFYVNQYQQNSQYDYNTAGKAHLLYKDIMNITQKQKSNCSKYSKYNKDTSKNYISSKINTNKYNKNIQNDKENISYNNTLQYLGQDYVLQSNELSAQKYQNIKNYNQNIIYNHPSIARIQQDQKTSDKKNNHSNKKASFFGNRKFRQTRGKFNQLFNSNCSISEYCMPSPIPFIQYDTDKKSQKHPTVMKMIKHNKIKSNLCGKSINQFKQYEYNQEGAKGINSQRGRFQRIYGYNKEYKQINIQNSYQNTIQLNDQSCILVNEDINQIVINQELIASKRPKTCNQNECSHKNIDIYYVFFTLTVQCAKLNSKNFNQVISLIFDLQKQYKIILQQKIPINKWYKITEKKLTQMLKSNIIR